MLERRRKVWISVAQAVAVLGGKTDALDELIANGSVRSTMIGAATYVEARDLFPYIEGPALRGHDFESQSDDA